VWRRRPFDPPNRALYGTKKFAKAKLARLAAPSVILSEAKDLIAIALLVRLS
jgi:hypothetical protein